MKDLFEKITADLEQKFPDKIKITEINDPKNSIYKYVLLEVDINLEYTLIYWKRFGASFSAKKISLISGKIPEYLLKQQENLDAGLGQIEYLEEKACVEISELPLVFSPKLKFGEKLSTLHSLSLAPMLSVIFQNIT